MPYHYYIYIYNSDMVKDLGGFNSQPAVEAWLSTLCASIPDIRGIDIYFAMSAESGIFKLTGYIGRLFKISNARADVLLFMPMLGVIYLGNLNNGTWTWKQITTS